MQNETEGKWINIVYTSGAEEAVYIGQAESPDTFECMENVTTHI